MLATPLSQPVRRSVWTLLDKVLNRALDYDARILHPEAFLILAKRLDRAVRDTAVKLVDVADFSTEHEHCLRLCPKKGGCDILAAEAKCLVANLSAAFKCLPGVAHRLILLGFTREQIASLIDLSGVGICLQRLQE
eukprot:5533777-Karenia_brevis.AAC.1